MTDRHIVEHKGILCTLFDNHIKEFIRCNELDILPCVAYGNAEKALVFLEQIHSLDCALVCTVASAPVVRLLCALKAQCKSDVSDLFKIVAELLVNQRCVCVNYKACVLIVPCKLDNIVFTDKRLSAREHIEMSAHFLALSND